LAGENAALIGEVDAGGIDQIDDGQAVAHGDLLRAQNFRNGFGPPGSGFDSGVVGDDYGGASFDQTNAGDDAGGGGLAVVFIVGDEESDFEEHGSRVDQFRHALARGQLARLVLLRNLGGAAALAQFLFEILQFCHQPAHVVCRCSHFVYSIGHAGGNLLGLDQRVLKAVWTVFAFVLAIALIYSIRDVLITFTLAIFLALLLSPLVTFVDHFTSVRIPRTVSLTVVYILLIAAFAAALVGVVSAVASDARTLSGTLPDALRGDPLSGLPLPAWLNPLRDRLGLWLHDRLDELGQNALSLTGEALRQLATRLGAAVSVIVAPILAFFFIKDGKALRDGFIHSVPRKHQLVLHQILQDLHRLLSRYLRALVILASVAFVFYSVFLSATGAAYAILLAGIAATLEFIPAVGPFVAMLLIVGVGLFSGYRHWILLIVFFVVYRVGQDYVLQPMLLSAGMRMHPLLIIFGVLAGGELAGIPGIFFSIPLMATLRLIFLRLWKEDALHDGNAT